MNYKNFFSPLLFLIILSGCGTVRYHKNSLREDNSSKLTLGNIQKEIKIGMSTFDVISIMGSPNIVTTTEDRCEVWVYDKLSTEVFYSENSGIQTLILGSSGGRSKTQKTLTVIINLDKNHKVIDFAYHSSKF